MTDEGYIKFNIDWNPAVTPALAEIEELRRWRRPLYEAGLIGEYAELSIGFGNMSARCPAGGLFVISGTQTGHLADLEQRHFSVVTECDPDANRVVCSGDVKASSESMTHAALYALDPSIAAVVHVHDRELWDAGKNRLPTTSGTVAYGTPDMAREFGRLYRETSFSRDGIAVMGGHEEGLVSIGASVEQAARRMLEHAQR